MIRWIVESPTVIGPVNATAPRPVTSREFARAIGRAVHRPSLLPAPVFALRIILGEMADPLVLTGQRVLPAQAQAHGYHFRYPEIDIAMRGIFGE
jgi:NAD dependent epimerase/dehydratase family enzyme